MRTQIPPVPRKLRGPKLSLKINGDFSEMVKKRKLNKDSVLGGASHLGCMTSIPAFCRVEVQVFCWMGAFSSFLQWLGLGDQSCYLCRCPTTAERKV